MTIFSRLSSRVRRVQIAYAGVTEIIYAIKADEHLLDQEF
jgi:hypothetical protein